MTGRIQAIVYVQITLCAWTITCTQITPLRADHRYMQITDCEQTIACTQTDPLRAEDPLMLLHS